MYKSYILTVLSYALLLDQGELGSGSYYGLIMEVKTYYVPPPKKKFITKYPYIYCVFNKAGYRSE